MRVSRHDKMRAFFGCFMLSSFHFIFHFLFHLILHYSSFHFLFHYPILPQYYPEKRGLRGMRDAYLRAVACCTRAARIALFRRCRGPCPKHTSVRVPRAYEDQSIHAQSIIPFVFLEHTKTRESMPKS